MYARQVGDQVLTFRFNSNLHRGNLILDDLQTGSTWSQLAGAALQGKRRGARLQLLPSIQTTWRHWRKLHPHTLVVDPQRSMQMVPPYLMRQGQPVFDPQRLIELGLEMTLGVQTERGTRAYPYRELARAAQRQAAADRQPFSPLRINVTEQTGEQFTVCYVSEVPTAWAEDSRGLLLPGISTTLTSWLNFYPQTSVFTAGTDRRTAED